MKYKHPKIYKGIRNQDIARQMVEENCLKCDKFMGQDHDFAECDIKNPCFYGFKEPSLLYARDFVKLESEEV